MNYRIMTVCLCNFTMYYLKLICSMLLIILDHFRAPNFTSAQIILGAAWIGFVILAATYSGNLVASFTVHKRKVNKRGNNQI